MVTGDDLLREGFKFPMEQSPFVRSVVQGRCSRAVLAGYAKAVYSMCRDFPGRLARMIALCKNRTLRMFLIENLLEEEGFFAESAGTELIDRVDRCHVALMKRFTRAVGVSDDQLDGLSVSGQWLDGALAAGNFFGAAGYVMVGTEANIPRTFGALIPGFREHYDIEEHALEFFVEHVEADAEHGIEGSKILAAAVKTEQDRRQVMEGVHRGAVALWWGHRRH